MRCFPHVVSPTYQFTALCAYPPYIERGSGLSQAVSRQILTAGIGVFSREHQVLLVAVQMTQAGSSSRASFHIVNYHTAGVPHSSVILRTDTGFLSGRKPKTAHYHVVIRRQGRSGGPAGQLPGRRTIMGAKKSPEYAEIW